MPKTNHLLITGAISNPQAISRSECLPGEFFGVRGHILMEVHPVTTKVLVAKRKVSKTWREAVACRGEALGHHGACVRAFDDYLSSGKTDYEAAFLALRDQQCL
jgi:hypothetical protein